VEAEGTNDRLIDVDWESDVKDNREYNVEIEITGYDRRGLLNEVLQAVNETKTDITAVSGRSDRNKMATIHMAIAIHSINHLQKVVDRIKQISDIYAVRRIMQ
jgi:GTP diphosphokinase / guanosine-3',5'-bis(diphosphate) 3'-diphosphatase